MSEKTLENKIKKYLKEEKIYYIKVHGSTYQKAGVPDIIACIRGKFIAFEIKNPNKKGVISKLQKEHQNKILNCGGYAYIIDDYEKFLKIYEGVIKDAI